MQHAHPITPALVALDASPRSPEAAIDVLLDIADDAGRLTDREAVRNALEERRATGDFGMGFGVAIPHAQTDGVTTPTVAFARSDDGVDFEAPDEEPATLLVLILVPADASATHLDVLKRLSRRLVDEDFREGLRTADDEATVASRLAEVVS